MRAQTPFPVSAVSGRWIDFLEVEERTCMNWLSRVGRRDGWTVLATALCFLFALLLIANIQPLGDGIWFWYGAAVDHHQHLYSDLHLSLQPFFPLMTGLFEEALGAGWLAFKALPALQAFFFCAGLLMVSRFAPLKDWQRGILISAVFGLTITSPFCLRFDDYHVPTQCFELFSIYLLLLVNRGASPRKRVAIVMGLGVLVGLCTSNRLNDGAGLFVGVGLALLVMLRGRRPLQLLLFCAMSALTLLLLIWTTGDSVSAWFYNSIVYASKMKGGTGSILLFPLLLPYRLIKALPSVRAFVLLGSMACGAFLLARESRKSQQNRRSAPGTRKLVLVLITLVLALSFVMGIKGTANGKIGEFGSLVLLGTGVWVHLLLLRNIASRKCPWEKLQVLFLIPFWALIAGALTSGVFLPDYSPFVALTLLLAPIASPWFRDKKEAQTLLVFVASCILVAALPAKAYLPYEWQHYQSKPLFVDREWYRHPIYGPMVIERDKLQFILPICQAIHATGPSAELLSLPYPYPNYFCGIKPWHGYVQTWYDTSGRRTIDALDAELEQAPPEWIVYQRALDTITLHEVASKLKEPLVHRELDREIMEKIVSGHWTVVQRSCFDGSDWILIRTSPPSPLEHHGLASDAEDRSLACSNAPEPTTFEILQGKLTRRH
jgi:hypothetical protein